MWNAIKGLLGSKKFWMTVIGSAVVAALAALLPLLGLGEDVVETILTYVAGFFGVGLAGYGLQDFGKAAKNGS